MIMDEATTQTHLKLLAVDRSQVDSSNANPVCVEAMEKRHVLISFKELPDYMKDNEFILGYYRADLPIREAFLSIFSWHNETLNVWTHLIGFIVFLVLTLVNLLQVPRVAELLSNWTGLYPLVGLTQQDASNATMEFFLGIPTSLIDLNLAYFIPPSCHPSTSLCTAATSTAAARWPFFVFLGGAMFCLLRSTTCHLLCCHSFHLNQTLQRLDYAGITTMIITSPIFYGFQCSPFHQFIYLSTITLMGLITITTLFHPQLSGPKYRSIRALLFCSMGLFGIVPGGHALIANWGEPQALNVLVFEIGMGLFYLIGTFFYVSRVPERWWPGWFDLAGHSHQLFHVFVILGALAHYGAAKMLLVWRNSVGCGGSM